MLKDLLIVILCLKIHQHIQSLVLLKQQGFKHQVDLAEFIGVGHSSLKSLIKQYKEFGFESLTNGVTKESSVNHRTRQR